MKRKITSLILTAAMLLSLASCGNGGTPADTTAQTTTTKTSADTTTQTTTAITSADTTTQTTTAVTSADTTAQTTTAETSADTTAQTTNAVTSADTTAQTTTAVTSADTTAQTTTAKTTADTTAQTTTAKTTADTTAQTTTAVSKEQEKDDPAERMETQYEEQKSKYDKLYADLASKLDLPVISIVTLDKQRISSKEEYVTSIVDITNCANEYKLSEPAGVRVRGNSTANGSEKPYRIKFGKKQNMLGLHEGKEFKSWVLLRTQWNMAMDYMGFNLAKAILNGEYYSSDCAYVNVYINGRPMGMYLLCEQNQENKNRVNIYEAEENELGTDIGYFFEIDHYAEEEKYHFTVEYENAEVTDISGKKNKFKPALYSVKNDIYSEEQLRFLEKYTEGVFKILYEAAVNNTAMMFDKDYNVVSAKGVYSTPESAVDAVIDLKSLANVLILDELVHDYDVGIGSFFMAIDFTEDSNFKKLTFTAPWDFNWAYDGKADGGYYAATFQREASGMDRSNPWYITAMKAEWFRKIVKEKWAELSSSGVITDTTEKVAGVLETLRNDLGDEEWRVDNADYIINFVNGRVDWLNGQWR